MAKSRENRLSVSLAAIHGLGVPDAATKNRHPALTAQEADQELPTNIYRNHTNKQFQQINQQTICTHRNMKTVSHYQGTKSIKKLLLHLSH